MLIRGKEGLIHQTGKNIQNVFQNLFKQRGKWRREVAQLDKYYTDDAPRATNDEKIVVCMFDGRMKHGGMCDRWRGIVSMWSVCKAEGIKFKIYFEHPFTLEDFVVPNEVDWRITAEELSYNRKDSIAVFCGSNDTIVEPPFQRAWLRKHALMDYKQIHVYTNAHLERGNRFGVLFKELFTPTPILEQAIQTQLTAIAKPYVAIVLRFQQLLGDFVEGHYPVLSSNARTQLIQHCLDTIDDIYTRRICSGPVLVTSDSVSFLKEAQKRFPYVHIIPGTLVHMDYNDGERQNAHLKSFVDFFMVSKAREVYLIQGGKMYNSGFPRRAAQINGIPFHHVRFNFKYDSHKFYILSKLGRGGMLHAGNKAVQDSCLSLDELGYTPIKWKTRYPIHAMKYVAEKLLVRRILKMTKEQDVILLQWPEYDIRFIGKFYEVMKKRPHLQILVHDINTLRHFSSGNKMEKEFFRLAEMIIVHTPAMKEYIMQWGVKEDRIRVLTTFDYYIDSIKIPYRANSNDIVYAGNLAKTDKSFLRKFCKAVVGNVTLNCYGREVGKLGDACLYKGSFTPDCVSEIEGSWGLVWDGPSINSCKGDMGRYLRWNSPHKLSLYIVSGLPVIVWKNSAMADYVLQKDLGIAITNLQNIDKEIEKISAHRYNHMLEALKQEAEQLRSGRHLKNILEE